MASSLRRRAPVLILYLADFVLIFASVWAAALLRLGTEDTFAERYFPARAFIFAAVMQVRNNFV